MASVLSGSPEQLQQAAGDTLAHLGEIESQLQALAGCHDGFTQAIQSHHTSAAVSQVFERVFADGKSLASTLETIVHAFQKAGVNVGTQDEQGAAKVAAQMAIDNGALQPGNHVDVGSWA